MKNVANKGRESKETLDAAFSLTQAVYCWPANVVTRATAPETPVAPTEIPELARVIASPPALVTTDTACPPTAKIEKKKVKQRAEERLTESVRTSNLGEERCSSFSSI